MENIRRAVERAKDSFSGRPNGVRLESPTREAKSNFVEHYPTQRRVQQVELDTDHLQSQRIIAYDGQDPRSRSFDILRTEVLRSMDLKNWRTLAVTSPTPSCGKTLTAINLALSIARQQDRNVRLVDLDLRRPHIAASLGLDCLGGTLGVLEGRSDIETSMIDAGVGSCRLEILPTAASENASDLVASSGMRTLLQDLATCQQSRVVIFDLPPLLTSHDVISILPQVDCVLLVAAVGVSKISEIQECYRYLQEADVVRFVLNKVPESLTKYVYY